MKIRVNIDLKIGRVVKYFVVVDLLLLAGWGLIEPIFSIFIINKVRGATLVTVGISAAIYWFLKSILQLPFANYLDKRAGEKDDFYALIIGLLIAAFSAFSFSLVSDVWQLYVAQAFHALGFALYVASWPAIFSRHLDKDRVSFDWALDSTAVGISSGASGFLGSVIASQFGFPAVFVLAAFFSMSTAVVLLMVPDLVMPPAKTDETLRKDHIATDIR